MSITTITTLDQLFGELEKWISAILVENRKYICINVTVNQEKQAYFVTYYNHHIATPPLYFEIGRYTMINMLPDRLHLDITEELNEILKFCIDNIGFTVSQDYSYKFIDLDQ